MRAQAKFECVPFVGGICPSGEVIINAFHAKVHSNMTWTSKLVSKGAWAAKTWFINCISDVSWYCLQKKVFQQKSLTKKICFSSALEILSRLFSFFRFQHFKILNRRSYIQLQIFFLETGKVGISHKWMDELNFLFTKRN